jgi:hypothetical protein
MEGSGFFAKPRMTNTKVCFIGFLFYKNLGNDEPQLPECRCKKLRKVFMLNVGLRPQEIYVIIKLEKHIL